MLRLYRYIILVLLVILVGCALAFHGKPTPGVIVVEAQTFPVTLFAEWTPNPATDNVTSYTLTVGAQAPVSVGPTPDPTCACIKQAFSIAAPGSYTATTVANDQLVSTDPSSTLTSPPTSITFQVNKAANAPQGQTIKQK